MTGVPAPTGWETRRPTGTDLAWWEHSCPGGHVAIHVNATGGVRYRTGPSSYGPALTPHDARRHAWILKDGLYAAAQLAEHHTPGADPEPDPQLTIDDYLEEALRG